MPTTSVSESIDPAKSQPLVSLLPYQKAAVDREARLTWNCWSRQTGKSFTFSLRRIVRGLRRRRNQVILSAGERQSREVMEKVRMHCHAMKIWCEVTGHGLFKNTTFRQLEARLPGNIRIIALPANPLTARGFTGDVFLDEFAMHRDDDAIWSALFPTLLRGEGELDVASTPRGQKNMFYRLRTNQNFEHDTVTLAKAVSLSLDVDAEAMRSAIGDEQSWRQEFCCEFIDEATSFMTYDLIRACQDVQLDTPVDWDVLQRREAEVYAGIDVGRYRDVTAIWLWENARAQTEAAMHENIFVTRGLIVLESTPFSEQEATIARVLQQRGVRRCCVDATGMGLQLAERLAERFGEHRVEPVVFTAGLKSQLAGGLRVLAERGQLRIPPDETITNDWHSITRLVTSGGHLRFEADRSSGGHADRFWAAALGIHAAETTSGNTGLVTNGQLRFSRKGVW
ncbi:MAG: terminase family protein [Phycisphaerales bacterium]|nr:terminase family protein [Phycisphaerales bacterium]